MKRRLFWIVELFIWLLLLFIVSSGIMFAKYNYRKNFNTYQIFLPDVDGLIVGSPVKILGIQVGYVNQIDIVGDDVYVKFIITEPNVKIPQSSTITVEFSGLGGSKSLELYPPNKNKKHYDNKFLVIQSPKRIHDSLGLLNDMFDKIIEITYDVSTFMDKMGIIKNEETKNDSKQINKVKSSDNPESSKPIEELLNFADCWLDKATKQCNKFHEKLTTKKEHKNEQNYRN